jgi:hypothetical protein
MIGGAALEFLNDFQFDLVSVLFPLPVQFVSCQRIHQARLSCDLGFQSPPGYRPGHSDFLQKVKEHDSCQRTRLRRRHQASGFKLQERRGFCSCDPMIAQRWAKLPGGQKYREGNAATDILFRFGIAGIVTGCRKNEQKACHVLSVQC